MADDNEEVPKADVNTTKPTVLELHGYTITKFLGSGSYAVVKLAWSERHSCNVAIKIISKKKSPKDYIDKFLPREIEVVKLLKHPNIVIFLQSIETNNRVYLVMECAAGGDLLDAIKKDKVIKEKQAAIWFGQIVEGLDYCHRKGVVHRDMKCENVMLDNPTEQNAKIVDFGFARKDMGPRPDGSFEVSRTYCGSYAYAAPEILMGTPYVPQVADIWSCGVILYVMTFGRLPFDDSNHKKLLKQVAEGVRFPEGREVSQECRDLISKILVMRENRLQFAGIRNHAWFLHLVKMT